ncbi:hypothetical protein N7468_001376 [Penicillium chermesinum]|uniref:Short chain dehydrogenase/oxidoreductase n=1 Tax=Penicillium chermesinum TaxID=63820 RepID=A0A9W9PGH3_9EURO|nr:uncharacterized protein N7468_001376 [Penicillium chermesinum]KAJ5246393.1 hypothetical protein N7468_001376 [Penicillium chermesinum]KAJ6144675.1 hypothetical protein N7470_008570 [Penicillium chermesinum]
MSFLSRAFAPNRARLAGVTVAHGAPSVARRCSRTGKACQPIELIGIRRTSQFEVGIHNKPTSSKGTQIVPRYGDFNIQDRVYAITGGGRGLGLSMADALVEAGAKVYCLDRLDTPSTNFNDSKRRASEHGGRLEYRKVDVRDTQTVNEIFADIAARDKRLDGLVAAAGINHLQSALDHTQTALEDVMSINYNGVFNTATAAARQMLHYESPGSMLLVASMSGLIANKGMTSPVYNSSKAAVIQLTRSLAMEWGRSGIRVNSLCPGHVVTPMVEMVFQKNPASRAIWEAENMLGRLAMPEEFRGCALFALSDASSFMTGSTLVIDGGHTAW